MIHALIAWFFARFAHKGETPVSTPEVDEPLPAPSPGDGVEMLQEATMRAWWDQVYGSPPTTVEFQEWEEGLPPPIDTK